MDAGLKEALRHLNKQNEVMREKEHEFLSLESSRKSLLAQLILAQPGKSFAEREAQALATEDWRKFCLGHVHAETEFNHAKRYFEILMNAFYAEHSSFKADNRVIQRHGVET